MPHKLNSSYGGGCVPRRRNFHYGGWNLPLEIIYTLVVVKVYVYYDGIQLRWVVLATQVELQLRWLALTKWDNLHYC